MFVSVRDQLVRTVSSGTGDRTIVGLPGSFGTTEIWKLPFELLSTRYRTVTFDHFGTGETHVAPEFVTFDHQVELVIDLLDSLQIDRCILAGDSSMGSVAIEATARHSERFDALMLVSAGISYHPDDGVRRFVHGLRTHPDATLDSFVRMCLPEDLDGHLRRWLKDIILRTGPERAAMLVESFYGVDMRDRLADIHVPTMVVHGELDAVTWSQVTIARELAALVRAATLVVIKGAGHVPTLSRPQEVADAMEALIRRLDGGNRS